MSCYLSVAEFQASQYYCAYQACCTVTGEAAISGQIQEIIDSTASLFDNYMGRSLCPKIYVDRFKGNNTWTHWTKAFPITGIISFNYSSVNRSPFIGNYNAIPSLTTGAVQNYQLIDENTGMFEIAGGLSDRFRYELRYVAGYTEIPEDIKTAMKIAVAHISQQIDSGNLANPNFSVDGVKSDTGGFTFGSSKIITNVVIRSFADMENFPATVFKILEKYKASKAIGF